VEECPLPAYGECDALVKTVSCGVCNGTDGKLVHRDFKGFPPEVYPVMLGHEAVGQVVAVGSKVITYKVGDMVLLPFAGPLGGYTCAWGSYSEYGVVSDAAAYEKEGLEAPVVAYAQTPLEKDIDPVKGAMVITFREVLSSLKRFGVGAGEDVAVFGCGPVGLCFIKFLKKLGAGKVTAFDILPEKLDLAKDNGADEVLLANDPDVQAKLKALYPAGLPYVIDAVGSLPIINLVMPLLADQGKICCYGISRLNKFEFDWTDAPYNWQIQFQQMPGKADEGAAHDQIVEWLRDGTLKLDDYITEIADFSQILDVFKRLEEGKIQGKCIIKY